MIPTTEVAIIGAGTAGCLAAHQLTKRGLKVTLIEKSRGLGGRCSRRTLPGKISIDLGASSFRHTDSTPDLSLPPELNRLINQWQRTKLLTDWTVTTSSFDEPKQRVRDTEICGIPSMNHLHRALSQGIECQLSARADRIVAQANGRWYVIGSDGSVLIDAKQVIVTAPAQQALELCQWPHQWRDTLVSASGHSQAQWVCALSFDQPQTQLADVYRGKHNILKQAIRETSKPGRVKSSEVWVLHSTHHWAQQYRDANPSDAAEQLRQAFCDNFDITSSNRVLTSHRWLLADHNLKPISNGYLWDPDLNLGLCGDWLAGGGIRAALHSSYKLCAVMATHPAPVI